MESPSFSPPSKQQRLISPSSLEEGSPFKIGPHLSSSPFRGPAALVSFRQETPPRGSSQEEEDMHHSPPHIEQLRLFDTPHTPKSIIRRSTMARLPRDSILQRLKTTRVTRSGPELRRRPSKGTNVNPFTPRELNSRAKRKAAASIDSSPTRITLMEEVLADEASECKRLALKESNISRYKEEFHEVCVIGKGSFGTVYKCINRLDGCYYALKRSHHPVAGSADEPSALREVYAHAVLGSHTHLVRYYSAWAEDNHMLIQNEFCNGGTLFAKIIENSREDKVFTQLELHRLIVHIAKGLQYIHSMHLVHLDIKPENIFITFPESTTPMDVASSECAAAEDQYIPSLPVYKIGDMGHVTSVNEPQVEEGDCRFLPREILSENYSQLPKADIFALGLTAYCAGSNRDLPKNGNEWQNIRDGHLPSLRHCSHLFNALLQTMVCPDPSLRPSASSLVSHSVICPVAEKTKAELYKELNEEKLKNELLSRQLQEARKSGGSKPPKIIVGGARCNRSMSVGNIY